MITLKQVQKLRDLHDREKSAYDATHDNNSMDVYQQWVKACDELNQFIESIAVEDEKDEVE